MALLKVIEWTDNANDEIVHKFDMAGNVINRGSKLTVREGQAAVFCDKGRMADVFGPGMYKLDTNSLPIITRLLSWAYGFETPFKSDVYFVSTRLFVNSKWGTASPIIIRDSEFGAVRVRGYGTYSFRVTDPHKFMTELFGSHRTFRTEDIDGYILSMLVMGISDALGESGLSVLDMSGNLLELSAAVKRTLDSRFEALGLGLAAFNVESLTLPKELEQALDENAKLGILLSNADVYVQLAQADALKKAAENPGAAGAAMGTGLGFGMGMHLTETMRAGAGAAKFCPECGQPVKRVCAHCGAELSPRAKFCPECGEKAR